MGKILALFIIVSQAPITPWFDLTDIRRDMIMLFGNLALFIVAFRHKRLSVLYKLCMLPLVYIIIHSFFFWVPGYTIFGVAYATGLIGLMFLVAECEEVWLLRSLILIIPIQMAIRYGGLIPWEVKLFAGDDYISSWGSVRHAVRYSILIYAGTVAALAALRLEKSRIWKATALLAAVGGLFTIFNAYSNTVLAASIFSLSVIIGNRYGIKGVIVLSVLLLLAGLIVRPEGFYIDNGRLEMWKSIWHDIRDDKLGLFLGHGILDWPLQCGRFKAAWNPHNEILNLLYDFGLVGLFLFFGVFLLFLWCSVNKLWLFIGFSGLSACFLTGSARYPDSALIWIVFAGLCLKTARKLYDEQAY